MLDCCKGPPQEALLGKRGVSEATPLSARGRQAAAWRRRAFDCLTQGRPSNVDALPSTRMHAFFNEMMCLVGIGSLTLPYATSQVGLALSLCGLAPP